MQRSGTFYTLGFAGVVCIVCSIVVSGTSVLLRDRQQKNMLLERQRNVLGVTGLADDPQRLSSEKVRRYFDSAPDIDDPWFVEEIVVDLETGLPAETDKLTLPFDMARAARDPEMSRPVDGEHARGAQIRTVSQYGTVYLVRKRGEVDDVLQIVIIIRGQGLWSTMAGYLALESDGKTIRGITFYEHGETPGLGGEIDNPAWQSRWKGRIAYDSEGSPALVMRKGGAGPPGEDPHGFDGLSGATITARAVQHTVNFWLGPHGYGPFLKRFSGEKD